MHRFKNDYNAGMHPRILQALIETNDEVSEGYSKDEFTNQAHALLKKEMKNEHVDIHIVTGGTQANLICISSFLRPFEACISPGTGHINVHETGAIEATGHKVATIETVDGKLTTAHIQAVIDEHESEHMVKPKLVYLTIPTEVGTSYSKEELKTIYEYSKARDLIVYVDGARLASALALEKDTVTLEDLANYTDAFYIGGTKCGAMNGEAIVIVSDALKADFRFAIKQRGGLLAKGRIFGVQFKTLFEDGLYKEIGRDANIHAKRLRCELEDLGFKMKYDTYTNQIFPILPNSLIEKLRKHYTFEMIEKGNEHSVIRLVTSYTTTNKKVDEFINDLKTILDSCN